MFGGAPIVAAAQLKKDANLPPEDAAVRALKEEKAAVPPLFKC